METRKVNDFMTSKPATLTPDMGMIQALRTLLQYKQSAAPVVDENNNLVGLLSEADCMQTTLSSSIYPGASMVVADKMSTELQTVAPDTSLVKAAETLLNHKRRLLPVVKDGKLAGILTRDHILQALLDNIDKPKFS